MDLQSFLSRLPGEKRGSGKQYIACCPAHDDRKPSLSVTEQDNKILVHCQAGCTTSEIVSAMGLSMKDLFLCPAPPKWVFLREHIYHNEQNQVVAKKLLYDKGGGEKTGVWKRYEGGRYIKGLNGCKVPLYNLPSLIQNDDAVFIAEGEKDADTLSRMGYIATTSPNGAGSNWRREYNEHLTNRDIVILSDNDEAEEKHGERVANALVNVAKSVKLIPATAIYPEVMRKGDISDIAEQFGIESTREKLEQAMLVAGEYHPQAQGQFCTFSEISSEADNYRHDPWKIDKSGVHKEKSIGRGESTTTIEEYASPIPLLPSAIIENIDSGTEKVELKFYKFGEWRKIICERGTIASRNKILELANYGIEVTSESASLLVKYLSDFIAKNLDTLPRKRAKSTMGWAGNEFLPYTEKIVFDGIEAYKQLYNSISQKGTLGEWIQFIAPLRNNIELRLCMAASFASPIIEKAGENPFVFHLWGGTGAGKTVALMVAMSIWGNPAAGKMTRTMNMTQNSMLTTAAFLNSLPFAGDELQTIKSQWQNYDQLIMRITEGIDRGRMRYDKVNEIKSWKCSFIFSGEEPCTKLASGGGAKNRVIEVECFQKLVGDGNRTANFVREHYGQAGVPYIDAVKRVDITSVYSKKFSEIIQNTDTTDKQAGAMALMLIADDIASDLFWKGENPLTVLDVKKYLKSSSEVDNSERAYSYICDVVAKSENNFKSDSKEIWGRIEDETALINKTVLSGILEEAGFDFEAIKSKWFDKGYIKRNSQDKFVFQTKCYGIKASYIKLKLKSDENTDILQEELQIL